MDILLAFPGILLAIALVAVLGPSLRNVVLALGVHRVGGYARLVRGQVLKIRELEYVQAARALGAPLPRILVRHVVPATLSAVTVQATLGMAGAIIAEASLSFLGLGVQPPTPSWGTMLDAGRSHLFDAPHLTLVPGTGDRAGRAGLQLRRRRVARPARSARYLIARARRCRSGSPRVERQRLRQGVLRARRCRRSASARARAGRAVAASRWPPLTACVR